MNSNFVVQDQRAEFQMADPVKDSNTSGTTTTTTTPGKGVPPVPTPSTQALPPNPALTGIVTSGLLNVGPGSNPPAYVPNSNAPIGFPDATKGNVAGVWGYVGPLVTSPSNISSPPITCAVYGEGGVIGVNGFTGAIEVSPPDQGGDGVLGFGGSNGVKGVSASGIGVAGKSTSSYGVYGENSSTTTAAVFGTSSGYDGVHGESQSSQHAGVSGINTGGGVGLYASGKTAGQFEGNVTIAGDITTVNTINVQTDLVLTGADCAEQFDTYDAESLEPGTIVVIGENEKLHESRNTYDRRVAGVVSGAGEYRPAIVLDRRASSGNRVTVALVGKVYCKVDADPAPVAVGDLLTTSGRPGFAMKASDPAQAFGAVIGKALKPLRVGQGLIPILVALQ
jgi:hypothetical protein